ncbi:NAD(P)/FAD-dependent oxidoreductase [Thermoclostridium caenicola]|uniref:NADH:ubiquinone reductase (non-electrogenic) n=2 Tax=Thermoclostridium caenicola TaxID=659425 RepID=A0A1M6J8A5_9FIRM|nr:NAD(P)/FAD-dependent oxidoreductase [Thermoclostridium caenicola]SHJ42904.1 NADH dehydrogenase [Thermoclostridium caenicola]
MSKKVVIVGAGYAGIEAALTLNKKKKKDKIEITLIDKNPYHTLLTEIHEVAGNRVSEEAVRIPLRSIFKYTDVNLVLDEIKEFDLDNNTLRSEDNTYHYDYLILAMGSTPNFFGIPGLKEHAFTLWSFEDAVKIREHIKRTFILAEQEKDSEKRKRLLTFVVAGAGFTGVEMIGELAIWVKSLCKDHNIPRKDVRLVIVDMLPRILNTLNEKNAAKAHQYMEKKLGIEIMTSTKILEATDKGLVVEGGFIETATIIWAAGVRSTMDVENIDAEKLGGAKRLAVDEFGRTKHKNVYVAGDISGLLDENNKFYPAMVENAIQTGHGAAMNILNDIRGKEPQKIKVKMHGTMVSVGNYFAVSEILGRNLPVWLSIVMKFLVNIHYLWEITGFRGAAVYLYHEILDRRQRKNLVEKHYTTNMRAWWTTPLRLFLGGMWLYEGIKKVIEGWLKVPKLAEFLGMAADSQSAATGSALYITEVAETFSIKTGIINFILGTESKIVDGTAIDAVSFAKVELFHFGDFNLVPWFLRNVVLASDGLAMFFQVLVVILEVGIGLMLLGGALSFVASAISLGLLAMFVTSTGLYMDTWWMVFASIAVMGGAGRAFGLDYYLIPWLNNIWESWWKNRKFRLFFKGSLDRWD